MLERGCPLLALPYLCKEKEDIAKVIQVLCDTHYYREAWIVARLKLFSNDPTIESIVEKWVSWLDSTGNLEGAAMM